MAKILIADDILANRDYLATLLGYVKPIDLDQMQIIVQKIQDFWFTIVKLPPAE